MDRGFDKAEFLKFYARQERVTLGLPYAVMNDDLQRRATALMKTARVAVEKNASLFPLRESTGMHNKAAAASRQDRMAVFVYATLAQCEDCEALRKLDLSNQATLLPEHMLNDPETVKYAKASLVIIRFEMLLTRDNDCERNTFSMPDHDLYVPAEEKELFRKVSRKTGIPPEAVGVVKELMERCSTDELQTFFADTYHMSLEDVCRTSLAMMQICAQCGRFSEIMPKCGRCLSVRYCSAECQKLHWKQHKKECVTPAKK